MVTPSDSEVSGARHVLPGESALEGFFRCEAHVEGEASSYVRLLPDRDEGGAWGDGTPKGQEANPAGMKYWTRSLLLGFGGNRVCQEPLV